VRGFGAEIDAQRLGFAVSAFVTLRTRESPSGRSVAERIQQIPRVLELHDVAGDDCYLLRVVARDIDELKVIVREHIGLIPGVEHTTTTIVFDTLKQSHYLDVRVDAQLEVPS
jgi:Lrp/AsnC family leucine-responsive transcriptional regulator